MSEDADLSKRKLITQGAVVVTVIDLIPYKLHENDIF